MKFGFRGLARAEGSTILGADLAAEGKEAGTYRSPFLKLHGPRSTWRLLDRLTAQQASLARSVVLGNDDYLDRSYYEDQASGKRIAYELERTELNDFSSSWKMKPVTCIRAMNRAIGRIAEPARKERYVQAAVDLETLMDRQSRSGPTGQVYKGIPEYLMNGYTDMGSLASVTERNGREKIKVAKEHVRGRLVGAVAVLLFMLFPPITVFAFTAMPQLPFMAAGVTAFWIFAHLSPRLRPFLVPLLLVMRQERSSLFPWRSSSSDSSAQPARVATLAESAGIAQDEAKERASKAAKVPRVPKNYPAGSPKCGEEGF